MRSLSRVISTLLLAVGVVTCSESSTGPRRAPLRLAFAPQFTEKAAAIYRNLASFAITLDNVHVVVRAQSTGEQPGAVLADTTIVFPSTANEVTISIDLTIQGAEQAVVATVELREGTLAYFQGVQEIVARSGETTSAPAAVEIGYVGPGAAATSLVITPTITSQAVTLAPSTSFAFGFQAFDALHHFVTDLPVVWSISDPSVAIVSETGVVTATAKPGSVTLTVTGLNGVSATAPVKVQPVAKLVVIQGDNQTAAVGAPLPTNFAVQAWDAANDLVAGATIEFGAVDGRGSITPTSATTNEGGVATAKMTLGQGIGGYAFTATLAGNSSVATRVSATAISGPAVALGIVGGNNQADTVRATLGAPLAVKVSDAFGNPVAGQAVTFQVTGGRAFLGPVPPGTAPVTSLTATTGADGLASATLIVDTLAGAVQVTASAPQTALAPVTFTTTVKPGVAVKLVMLQQPSVAAQATLPLSTQPRVQVADQYGNAVPLPGVEVLVSESCIQCLRVTPGGTAPTLQRSGAGAAAPITPRPTNRRMTVTTPSVSRLAIPTAIARTQSISDTFPRGVGGKTAAITDASGVASFADLALNEFVGPWELEFFTRDQSLAVVFSSVIQLSPGPAASIIAWSVPDTSFIAGSGASLFPSVRVIDKVGNGIPKVSVNWEIADGVSKLDSTSTHTDADGVASPGTWQIVVGTPLTEFKITATPSDSKLENAPLTLYAIIQVIGQALPTRLPSFGE